MQFNGFYMYKIWENGDLYFKIMYIIFIIVLYQDCFFLIKIVVIIKVIRSVRKGIVLNFVLGL